MKPLGSLLSPVVRLKAESLGDEGRRWLAELPELVDELERQWAITVETPLGGGTAAFVARARAADGASVVLKVSVPDPDFAD